LDDRIDDIIDRHDAEDPSAVVYNRHRDEIVPGDQPGRLFAVAQRRYSYWLAGRSNVYNQSVVVAENELSKGYCVHEPRRSRINNIKGIDRLPGTTHCPDVLQRALDGPVGGHADKFRGHDAAGTRRRVS